MATRQKPISSVVHLLEKSALRNIGPPVQKIQASGNNGLKTFGSLVLASFGYEALTDGIRKNDNWLLNGDE